MSDDEPRSGVGGGGPYDPRRPLDPRDYSRRTLLANERTFLAWWRTGLAALTVGLACARIIPIVGQVQAQWPYTTIGVLFAALGVVCLVYGEQRRRAVDEAVRRGDYAEPDGRVLVLLTVLAALAGLGLVAVFLVDA
jgi:putative membrane protein